MSKQTFKMILRNVNIAKKDFFKSYFYLNGTMTKDSIKKCSFPIYPPA